MQTKLFEIRDEGTFIPMMATLLEPRNVEEDYLLGRAGYGAGTTYIILQGLEPGQATYDPFGHNLGRTRRTAHQYILANWDQLNSGDVIDVQFILGETPTKKQSERFL